MNIAVLLLCSRLRDRAAHVCCLLCDGHMTSHTPSCPQVVKTQSMRASPYIGPFEERVKAWEAKLVLTQDTLDAWLQCQQVGGG